MTDLNRDTGGTSQRRGVHGDPWRRPALDTPLGQLIAGEISQAEYRRLLRAQAHRDLRYEELDLRVDEDDESVRRLRDQETRDEWRSGGVIVWLALAIVGWILIAAIVVVLVGSSSAAPRSAPQATPHVDVSGRWSPAALIGAPHERLAVVGVPWPSRHDGGAPTAPGDVHDASWRETLAAAGRKGVVVAITSGEDRPAPTTEEPER